MWDHQNIRQKADESIYETFRPTEEADDSLEELKKKNPEVFGWITVEDTHIDYPLVQAENNSKYVNTDVYGNFSLSGSIFLDCRNQKDFSDENNIIYGHHMAEKAMFGELEYYQEKAFFDQHLKGRLYFENRWHPVEFFAFLPADAYDSFLYQTSLDGEEMEFYVQELRKRAVHFVELPFTGEDRFVTLSTCTTDSTNGRHLLVGRIKTAEAAGKTGE